MGTCPRCGANSRRDPHFEVSPIFTRKDAGESSPPDGQATWGIERYKLEHVTCGWTVFGQIEGGDFLIEKGQEGG